MDSNADGIGDIKGIISKLDYLKELGVNIIWLSPIYKSPNDDNGYDISDYYNIMDEFGTMDDCELLLSEIHNRDMKIIMDLIINHTSDEHPWFINAKSCPDNNYRNYYIWRKAPHGCKPNNWRSIFKGSAWEYDEASDEFYLHLFSKKQPDLNWENPDVRRDIYQMMNWWLGKGIDGFRMDAINMISKPQDFPDANWEGEHYYNGPRIHEYMKEMYDQVFSRHRDVVNIGEMVFTPPVEANRYFDDGMDMIIHFDLMGIDTWNILEWNLKDLKNVFAKWQNQLNDKGWSSLYLNNHDQPRMVSRFGNDSKYRVESAKLLATLLYTQKGTPFLFQGEEIGMTNVAFDTIHDYRDVETINMYQEYVVEKGMDVSDVMQLIHQKSRDNARTPMQWSDTKNGGFTTGVPWIKVNPNYKEINVEHCLHRPDSIFFYYKELIRIRKEKKAFIYGSYHEIWEDHEQIFSYIKELNNDKFLVILNFSKQEAAFHFPMDIQYSEIHLIINNYGKQAIEDVHNLLLKPYEASIYQLI